MNHKQKSVDTMSVHFHEQIMELVERHEFGNSDALHDEWVVDGQDPEDGEYEFIFIDDLTEV
jgi:hypothetical protein